MHGIAPSYLVSLLSLKQCKYNVWSVGNNTLEGSDIKLAKTTGDRAFAVAAPVLWNALPSSFRAIDDITSFKKLLKTHLFGKHIFRYFRFIYFSFINCTSFILIVNNGTIS